MNKRILNNNMNNKKYIYYSVCVIFASILFFFLVKNIPSIPTIFELPDEAGYLWNTAYFLNVDWDEIGKSSFYGYGYSLFLIPAFVISETGIDLIRGAYYTNIIFLVGIFIMYCIILKELFQKNTIWNPVISLIGCILPYLMVHIYNVKAEVCLTFFYTLLILSFYYILKTRKIYYYILAIACSCFIPFIHPRGIILSIVFYIIFFVDFLMIKKIRMRECIFLLIFFIITILLFRTIKSNIIDYRNDLRIKDALEINKKNLITLEFLIQKIELFFNSNILKYGNSFFSRIFYSIIATAGTVFWIIIYLFLSLKEILLRKENVVNKELYTKIVIFSYVLLAYIFEILASVINSIGYTISYVYYGRYYENTLSILVVLGLYIWNNEKLYIKMKYQILLIISTIIMAISSSKWINNHLANLDYTLDTSRLAAFSRAIRNNMDDFNMVIFFATIITILISIIYIYSYCDNSKRMLAIILLMIIWMDTNTVNFKAIQDTAHRAEKDRDLAEYIVNNDQNQRIYFLEDNSYKYEGTKYRMQVLIKDRRVYELKYEGDIKEVINKINSKDYLILYKNTKIELEEIQILNKVFEGTRFILFQKL